MTNQFVLIVNIDSKICILFICELGSFFAKWCDKKCNIAIKITFFLLVDSNLSTESFFYSLDGKKKWLKNRKSKWCSKKKKIIHTFFV